MGNLKESIKLPSEEEKKLIFMDIIFNLLNSSNILFPNDLIEKMPQIREKLSEDEFNVVYSLALEIKKSILGLKRNDRLLEFLNISEYCKNDNGNLMRFIKAAIENIQQERKFFPNRKWELQVGKIFDRMNGKDPYGEEMKYNENRTKNIHIVEQ